MQLTTTGIILRDCKIEQDRLLTILTKNFGVIHAYANGANRTRSRLCASTEMLSYSDLSLFKNRDKYTVDKADSLRIFFGVREALDKLALGSYFAELTAELAPRNEESDTYLKLLLNSLHLLEKDMRPLNMLKAVYELRLLTLAGYMPDLVGCRECGTYESEFFWFSARDGEILCGNCKKDNEMGDMPLSLGVLAAMRHIVYTPADKLFAFSLSPDRLSQLSKISEQYLLYQIEKTFPTLEFYNHIAQM